MNGANVWRICNRKRFNFNLNLKVMSMFSFEKILKIVDTILHILLGSLTATGMLESKNDESE